MAQGSWNITPMPHGGSDAYPHQLSGGMRQREQGTRRPTQARIDRQL